MTAPTAAGRAARGAGPATTPTTNEPPRLLTADQVAQLLAVPRSWVYAETRAGRLPHVKLGRYYRYARPSIEAFVAGLERGPVPYRRYLADRDAAARGLDGYDREPGR